MPAVSIAITRDQERALTSLLAQIRDPYTGAEVSLARLFVHLIDDLAAVDEGLEGEEAQPAANWLRDSGLLTTKRPTSDVIDGDDAQVKQRGADTPDGMSHDVAATSIDPVLQVGELAQGLRDRSTTFNLLPLNARLHELAEHHGIALVYVGDYGIANLTARLAQAYGAAFASVVADNLFFLFDESVDPSVRDAMRASVMQWVERE